MTTLRHTVRAASRWLALLFLYSGTRALGGNSPQQQQQQLMPSEPLGNLELAAGAPCPAGQGENIFIESRPLGRCGAQPEPIRKSARCLEHLHTCVMGISSSSIKNNKGNGNSSLAMRVLVTGGAGFVGSHLVDSLMLDGHFVTVLDDFSTGRRANIEHWLAHANFKLVQADVAASSWLARATQGPAYEQIYHLAAPASPAHYMAEPVRTIHTIVLGFMNVLQLAAAMGHPNGVAARILLASTSEIYGDPLVHPQPEHYWGHANPVGPRSCYDESKRLSESLAAAHMAQHSGRTTASAVVTARIFNTYGPRMHLRDGRVISNFVSQALRAKPLTVYGTGNQTRSFQYVSDLVAGLRALMASNLTGPFNLGNPEEISISELAALVLQHTGPGATGPRIEFSKLPVDDPARRRPDITKAMSALGWRPAVNLTEGLRKTVEYFRQELSGAVESLEMSAENNQKVLNRTTSANDGKANEKVEAAP